MEVAHSDVTRLMHDLASGEERLFEVSLFVLVSALSERELASRTERVRALLHTIFLDAVARPTTFEHAQAFRSFLPEGRDELGRTITLDTASLATTFPFLSNSLTMPGGTFLGLTGTGEPVLLDPWHPKPGKSPCLCGRRDRRRQIVLWQALVGTRVLAGRERGRTRLGG